MAHTTLVRRRIESVINRVMTESGRSPRIYKDEQTLTETIGLDSLDLAQVVVSLEREFGVDPFRDGAPSVSTFGDFVELYQDFLGGTD